MNGFVDSTGALLYETARAEKTSSELLNVSNRLNDLNGLNGLPYRNDLNVLNALNGLNEWHRRLVEPFAV